MVAARDSDEARARGRDVQRARVLDRDDLVALGVQEQQRGAKLLGGAQLVVLGQQRAEAGRVGAERQAPVAQPAREALPRSPGRSRRPRARPAAAADTSAM